MRRKFLRNNPISLIAALTAVMTLYSCASIGNPSGGPRDEDPPVAVRSNPLPYSVNFTGKKVTIDFDELVNVKDAFTKVTVSPAPAETPRVSALGRRVTVQFADTLEPNTTYTIDFGNSIEDNNEGNKLQSFSFSFATGPEIDTLRISGIVLNAADLEPRQEMLVGVHSNPADSAFKLHRFERMTKTDDRGRFSIRGLKPGSYRVYALGDLNNDYRWDNPMEDVAFYDVLVSPTTEQAVATDSIYNLLTHKLDTVVKREYTRFLPNDILLNAFNTNYKPQYLTDNQRVDSTRIKLIFNAPAEATPQLSIVGAPGIKDWYILEKSRRNDSLTYWLKPKSLIMTDTLRVAATYLRTDSTQKLSAVTDTLRLITMLPKVNKKEEQKKKKREKSDSIPEMRFLDVSFLSSASHDVYAPVVFETAEPLDTLISAGFRLEQKVDTLWKPVSPMPPVVRYDTLNPRRFKIEHKWEYGTGYKLYVDSLTMVSIYGLHNKPAEFEFNVKAQEEYSNLRFSLIGLPDSTATFVQLLNRNDEPVRVAAVSGNFAEFTNVAPGQYYARLIEDSNGNGEYDTGNPDTHLQPELVYYFPRSINLKKNWSIEQSWDINAFPIDRQKPAELRKAKYEDEKRSRNKNNNETDMEDEQDEPFDPTANPFDPNQKKRRRNNPSGYSY